MKRLMKLVSPLVAVSMVLAFSYVLRAADAPAATGTVSVTVKDKDGKPAEGVTVRVTAPRQAAPAPAAPAKPNLADEAPKPAEEPKPAPGAGAGNRAPAIAEGKTDKEGKVTLEKVPAGDFNLSANLRGQGSARQKITVKAGETLAVELKLAPRTTGGAAPAAPAAPQN